MKKSRSTIREKFGLTYEEISRVLGVSKSHFSMSELYLRELPASALILLSQLEDHVRSFDKESKAEMVPDDKRPVLLRLLEANVVERVKIGNKSEALQRRRHQCRKRAAVNDFLKRQENPRLFNVKFSPGISGGESKIAAELIKLEIRLELLEYERKLIERMLT